MTRIKSALVLLVFSAVCSAQVSLEEAQRRLHEKLSTRPSSTQPASEVDRLRADNRRLRAQNVELQTEVAQLRDALASAGGGGATRPATSPQIQPGPDLAAKIIGRWEGGTLASGNAFNIEFQSDGNYVQSWSVASRTDHGHYEFVAADTLEMWTGTNPRHNQYRASLASGELTLTPLDIEGGNVPQGKPMVLKTVK